MKYKKLIILVKNEMSRMSEDELSVFWRWITAEYMKVASRDNSAQQNVQRTG